MGVYGAEVVARLQDEGVLPDKGRGDRNLALETQWLWNTRHDDVIEVPYTIESEFNDTERAIITDAINELFQKRFFASQDQRGRQRFQGEVWRDCLAHKLSEEILRP